MRHSRRCAWVREQCLWLKTYDTVEELNSALAEFKQRDNTQRLVQKHRWMTPTEARAALTRQEKAA